MRRRAACFNVDERELGWGPGSCCCVEIPWVGARALVSRQRRDFLANLQQVLDPREFIGLASEWCHLSGGHWCVFDGLDWEDAWV